MRMSKREADAFSARVDAALERLKQTGAAFDVALTKQQKALWNQLGAHHRLRLKREHPDLYRKLMAS